MSSLLPFQADARQHRTAKLTVRSSQRGGALPGGNVAKNFQDWVMKQRQITALGSALTTPGHAWHFRRFGRAKIAVLRVNLL